MFGYSWSHVRPYAGLNGFVALSSSTRRPVCTEITVSKRRRFRYFQVLYASLIVLVITVSDYMRSFGAASRSVSLGRMGAVLSDVRCGHKNEAVLWYRCHLKGCAPLARGLTQFFKPPFLLSFSSNAYQTQLDAAPKFSCSCTFPEGTYPLRMGCSLSF